MCSAAQEPSYSNDTPSFYNTRSNSIIKSIPKPKTSNSCFFLRQLSNKLLIKILQKMKSREFCRTMRSAKWISGKASESKKNIKIKVDRMIVIDSKNIIPDIVQLFKQIVSLSFFDFSSVSFNNFNLEFTELTDLWYCLSIMMTSQGIKIEQIILQNSIMSGRIIKLLEPKYIIVSLDDNASIETSEEEKETKEFKFFCSSIAHCLGNNRQLLIEYQASADRDYTDLAFLFFSVCEKLSFYKSEQIVTFEISLDRPTFVDHILGLDRIKLDLKDNTEEFQYQSETFTIYFFQSLYGMATIFCINYACSTEFTCKFTPAYSDFLEFGGSLGLERLEIEMETEKFRKTTLRMFKEALKENYYPFEGTEERKDPLPDLTEKGKYLEAKPEAYWRNLCKICNIVIANLSETIDMDFSFALRKRPIPIPSNFSGVNFSGASLKRKAVRNSKECKESAKRKPKIVIVT